MIIGVSRQEGQPLVAATPDTTAQLQKLGYEVLVQAGAGQLASYPDSAYQAAGARLTSNEAEVWGADVVLCPDAPTPEQRALLRPEATLISRLAPARSPELIQELAERRVTALALDVVPRISRAQSMDVLSSMANIAGYRAVIEAASHFGRLFTGQVTAAGKVPPATVYVIGAGVAGLAAIGTANSMGAVVRATDLRPEVGEQVESMGATFAAIPAPTQESEDGYAKEMTDAQAKAAAALYGKESAAADIVITTANIPGRPAPRLLTAQDVAAMRPGSVIVDMAAATGGNCELTAPGQVTVTDNGVTIIGYTDLAGRLPGQASQLYGRNLVNLLALLTPEKDGQPALDLHDEVVRGIAVAHDGDVLWPPPPVKVSAAPAKAEAAGAATDAGAGTESAEDAAAAAGAARKRRTLWLGIAAVAAVALMLLSPTAVAGHYMVLMLAVVVGFYVITAVTHSLHTPLMSETNAISGIILLGAILQVGSANWVVSALSFVAIVVASINIFGGFTVTHRMLHMFRKEA